MHILKYRFCTLIACLSFAALAGVSAQEDTGEKPEKVKPRREVKKEAAEKEAAAAKSPSSAKDQADDKPRHPGPPPGLREGRQQGMEAMRKRHAGAGGGHDWSPEKMEKFREHMEKMRKEHGGAPGKGGPPWAQKPQGGKPAASPWAPRPRSQGPRPGGAWGQGGGFAGSPRWGMGFAGAQGPREMMMFRRMQMMKMGAMARGGHGMPSAPGKAGADGLCDHCKRKLDKKDSGDRKDKRANADKKQKRAKKKQD